MVISFIAIAISLPNTLVRDREIGWLRRISTTPVHPSRLLGAQLILDLVLAAAAIVIIIVGGTAIFGAPLTVRHPVLHPLPRTRHCRDLLAGLGCRRRGSDADRGQLLSAACSSSPSCSCRGCGFSRCRLAAPLRDIMWYSPSGAAVRARSLLGVRCDTSRDDPPHPGRLHARLCVRRRSLLPLGVVT